LLLARPYPHCLPKSLFLKKNQWNKQRKFKKDFTLQCFGALSVIFLRHTEKLQNCAFLCIRSISNEISTDNFVLVVSARENNTHTKRKIDVKNPSPSCCLAAAIAEASRDLSSCSYY
jgi:hypothetical protein